MMMGAVVGHTPLRVILPSLFGAVANGTSVTVTTTVEANITGGFPPFTHDWKDDDVNFFFQASTSVTTRVQVTGTNTEHIGTYVYKLTEANGVTTTTSASFDIVQGTP